MSLEPKERITITIDKDLLAFIDQVCERRGKSRSALIEALVERACQGTEAELEDLEKLRYRAIVKVLTTSPGVFDAIVKAVERGLTAEERREGYEVLKQDLAWADERRGAKKAAKRKGGKRASS